MARVFSREDCWWSVNTDWFRAARQGDITDGYKELHERPERRVVQASIERRWVLLRSGAYL